ncbi:MAG TPA: amino acid ABC transporter permease [Dehalococcoidia bacterium]|nr:amino acid ABC transporter permease [Dehalococcoidia bacterium]
MAAGETASRPAEHGADIGPLLRLYRRFAKPIWFLAWTIAAGVFLWFVLDVDWDVVGDYLFDYRVMEGVEVTIKLTLWSMFFGVILGVVFGVMRVSQSAMASGAAGLYIWLIRGTPLLLQILVVFFGLREFVAPESLGFGRTDAPFGSIPLLEDFNNIRFRAAVLALAINEGAYMAEIVRGGIISVDPGQTDAARSLGMTNLQATRRIILPQALRVMVPPSGNEFIAMAKNSSLVSVIGVFELLKWSQSLYADNFQVMELLLVAAFWYLVITSVLSIGQAWLEAHLSLERQRGTPFWQRVGQIFTNPRQAHEGA